MRTCDISIGNRDFDRLVLKYYNLPGNLLNLDVDGRNIESLAHLLQQLNR